MRDLKKTLENVKEVIKDELKKLIKKGELTPAEMDTVFKAVDSIKDICEMCGEYPEGNEYSQGTHWMNDPYAMGHIGPARSPVTGRYISSGMYGTPRYNQPRTNHVYGHSIKDRMVARLEPMYDEAASEHERQMIDNAINRIQSEL